MISGYSRTFRMLMEFSDGRVISGQDIGSAVIEHPMSDDNAIPIGSVLSRRAEITVYSDVPVFKGDGFRLYLYMVNLLNTSDKPLSEMTHGELAAFTHEDISAMADSIDGEIPVGGVYIPFGEFVTTSAVRKGEEVTVTAYDRLRDSDRIYTPGISLPASAEDVTDDILRQLGIGGRAVKSSGALLCSDAGEVLDSSGRIILCSEDYTFMIGSVQKKTTCRQILGWIAAMYGKNGIIDRDGIYTTVLIQPGSTALDPDKTDEPELADRDIRLSGISCVVDEEVTLEAGSPSEEYAVETECPYMTQERLSELWTELSRLSWRPAQVFERIADPRHELGDVVVWKEHSIPMTSLTFNFDGGLSADITACGEIAGQEG